MKRNRKDAATARALASKMLVLENPAPTDEFGLEVEAKARVADLMLSLQNKGINIASLSEYEWKTRLQDMGLGEVEVSLLLEDIAQWAVTDDE